MEDLGVFLETFNKDSIELQGSVLPSLFVGPVMGPGTPNRINMLARHEKSWKKIGKKWEQS